MDKQSTFNEEKKLEMLFRKAIWGLKTAKSRKKILYVDHIEDLQKVFPDGIWLQDGSLSFTASAEFFFENKEGGYYSSGDRLEFEGNIRREGEVFTLEEPILLKTDVHYSFIKTNTNNE